MDRRSFHRGLVLTALSPAVIGCAQAASTSPAQDRAAPVVHRRTLTEYVLPPAAQTHELVKVPGAPLVVVSQQSNSQLVKLWLDSTTEQISGVQAFPLGPADAMLHGLALSTRYPGLVDHFSECPGRDHPGHLRRRVHADPGRRSRGIAHPALQGPPPTTPQHQRAGHRADQRNRRPTRHRTPLTLGPAHHSHTR